MGDRRSIPVQGEGDVVLRTNKNNKLVMNNVLLVPGISRNLISVFKLIESGYEVQFKSGRHAIILKDNKSIATATVKRNLWVIQCDDSENALAHVVETEDESELNTKRTKSNNLKIWHLRFNHANLGYLCQMANKGIVRRMNIRDDNDDKILCKGCA